MTVTETLAFKPFISAVTMVFPGLTPVMTSLSSTVAIFVSLLFQVIVSLSLENEGLAVTDAVAVVPAVTVFLSTSMVKLSV